MNKYILAITLIFSLSLSSCLDSIEGYGLGDVLGENELTSDNIVNGLKEALKVSAKKTSNDLGLEDGYLANEMIKLALPEDVATVLTNVISFEQKYGSYLEGVGLDSKFKDMKEDMVVALNRAAEDAAPESFDIFVDAIVGMNVSDGLNILTGDSIAATSYLKSNTQTALIGVFSPIVKTSLDKVNATQLWSTISNSYNSYILPAYKTIKTASESEFSSLTLTALGVSDFKDTYNFPGALPTDLSEYTTDKALSGLFTVVGEEESLLRANVDERLGFISDFTDGFDTDLIKDIFNYAQNESE